MFNRRRLCDIENFVTNRSKFQDWFLPMGSRSRIDGQDGWYRVDIFGCFLCKIARDDSSNTLSNIFQDHSSKFRDLDDEFDEFFGVMVWNV